MNYPAQIQRVTAGALGLARLLVCTFLAMVQLQASQHVIVVNGEAGDPSYLSEISATAGLWSKASEKAGSIIQTIDSSPNATSQLERLRTQLSTVQSPSEDPLWIVLIGHGNAQGSTPKFALNGPDLTPNDLSSMLANLHRPVILVAGFACSGAFIAPLAGADRILIAATRSAREDNWVRFPRMFAEAIASPDADLDADGQVSVFEAWFRACGSVEAYYKQEGRMLTEHSILTESGVSKPLDYLQFAAKPKDPPKVISPTEFAPLASQCHLVANPHEASLSREARNERQLLESELVSLRKSKAGLRSEDYQAQLETLLLRLHSLYRAAAVPSF